MTPQEIAEKSTAIMWADDVASKHLGMKLLSVAPGTATLEMEILPFMANGHGTCHGGYLFLFADSVLAFCCNTYNQRNVVQNANMTFIRPGNVGDVVTGTGREISRTAKSGIYDISLTNQHGKLVGEFRGLSRVIEGTFF